MTKISIKNFQSIKDIDFIIDGFTVIVGKNNIGKSAIIRAIQAALNNRTGKNFIKKGTKKSTVIFEHNDLKFEWEKESSTASYKIEGHDNPFSKLNGAIPKPITDAGFDKIQIANQKINPLIAEQFEPLFLINLPTATDVIASMYQIDILSKADDLCQKFVRSQNTLLKTRESDLNEIQNSLKKFNEFDTIKEEVKNLIKKNQEIQKLEEEISLIISYENKIKESKNILENIKDIKHINIPDIDNMSTIIDNLQWIKNIEEKYNKYLNNTKNFKNIIKINIPDISYLSDSIKEVTKLKELDNSLINSSYQISQIEKIKNTLNIKEIESKIENLSLNLDKLNFIQSTEKKFLELIKLLKNIKVELESNKKVLDTLNKEFGKFDICPLCERKL